jgi:hypothetical protein
LRFRIHALFEESGIILAYPQRDLHIDSTRPLEVRLMNPPNSSGQSPGPSPKPVLSSMPSSMEGPGEDSK